MAVSADDRNGLDSVASPHFGRCPYFVLVELDSCDVHEVAAVEIEHYGRHQPGQVPQFIPEQGADVMLTGGMGRRAIGFFEEIFVRLNNATIKEAALMTDECGATLACGSMLTQMMTGMRLEEAEWVLPDDVIKALDGLPEESMHCSGLAASTLQNALFNWRVSQMEKEDAD